MKKLVRFSKYTGFAVLFSCVLILSGLYPILTKGINFGIDFKPGLVQDVRIVPAAINVSYEGPASVSVEINPSNISLVISGVGADNQTLVYSFADYATVADLATAMQSVEGLTISVKNPSVSTAALFANSALSSVLSSTPYSLYYSTDGQLATVDQVRNSLSSLDGVSVKEVGSDIDTVYQIRIEDDGNEGAGSTNMQQSVTSALGTAFGSENIAVIKTDYIGAQYSGSLILQSVFLVVAALALIWLYATIRFKWDFALASVIAIVHDSLVIISFIAWTQMEFSTITLAAILTILGYGINDTVVVLDRVRENMRKMNTKKFMDIVDRSQSDCFGRTMITTITTLLAVLALCIFTTGSIHDFALALIIGIISSAYSTIMITSAFLAVTRRNWKPSDEVKDMPANVVQFPGSN
ncbi:MAG: protein translocase subunit SecF [Spirochaetaceae bacterium]|nr:protein translocase subunit SecF [Spirochaetaceae bacterium]